MALPRQGRVGAPSVIMVKKNTWGGVIFPRGKVGGRWQELGEKRDQFKKVNWEY